MDGREAILGRRDVLLKWIGGLIFGSLCLAEPAAAQPDAALMWNAGAFLAGGLCVMASGIMAPSGGLTWQRKRLCDCLSMMFDSIESL